MLEFCSTGWRLKKCEGVVLLAAKIELSRPITASLCTQLVSFVRQVRLTSRPSVPSAFRNGFYVFMF